MSDAAGNHTPPVADTQEYRAQYLAGPQKSALIVGIVGIVAYAILAIIYFVVAPAEDTSEHASGLVLEATRYQQPFLSFLTGYMFWTLVGLGSIFFLFIQYVTGGRWGILLRRPLEANCKTLFVVSAPLFLVLAATMFMGKHSIYWWAQHAAHHPADVAKTEGANVTPATPEKTDTTVRPTVVHPELDVDEDEKVHDWLSPTFTVLRGIAYFIIFGVVVLIMLKKAMKAEHDDDLQEAAKARNSQKYVASPGLFVFAILMTWIATDWVMSLEPTFASSMFPVIMFDNAAVAAYAVGLLTLIYLKKKGEPRFANLFPATEQIHLGSLLLAFTLAWTYFNFSQYMLIWIGNLAEEIPYYLKRTNGGWGWYAAIAVIFHFPIPFLLLLFRRVKSSPNALRNIAIMLLIVIAFDVTWWIEPSHSHAHAPKFYLLMDAAAWLGIGGIWMFVYFMLLKKQPLLPTREVYLLESYHHGH